MGEEGLCAVVLVAIVRQVLISGYLLLLPYACWYVMHICMRMCVCMYVCVHVCVSMCVYVRTCEYVCVHVCVGGIGADHKMKAGGLERLSRKWLRT